MDKENTVEDFQPRDVYRRTDQYPGDLGGATYEDYQRIKRQLSEDLEPIATSDTSVFILGPYNPDGSYDRLQTAKEELSEFGPAYLLEDVLDEWDYWTTKFKVIASFSNFILGIYGHGDGGHVWEAGYLDHPPLRERTYVLKRDYPVDNPAEEPFDPMFAHFMKALKDESQDDQPKYIEWCANNETDAKSFEDALDQFSARVLASML